MGKQATVNQIEEIGDQLKRSRAHPMGEGMVVCSLKTKPMDDLENGDRSMSSFESTGPFDGKSNHSWLPKEEIFEDMRRRGHSRSSTYAMCSNGMQSQTTKQNEWRRKTKTGAETGLGCTSVA